MPNFLDLTGKTFGRWTALHRAETVKQVTYWACKCSCGTLRSVSSPSLMHGVSRSCGCLQKTPGEHNSITHGMSDTSEYQIWEAMIARCHNPSNKGFRSYGQRGITVCARWRESFTNFFSDMGARPERKSLDRIDNDGPYSPENCRWATRKEQANNTRQNRRITLNGVTLTHSEWAKRLGCPASTISTRLKRGWTPEQAISRTVQKHTRRHLEASH